MGDGVRGKNLYERCDLCHEHAAAFAKLSRCERCLIAKYCSRTCQKTAWPTHKLHCSPLSDARALEDQKAVRERVKSGQPAASPGSGIALLPAPIWIKVHEMLRNQAPSMPREFVLATGERKIAMSNSDPPFSVFELPDHFEFVWPMHILLPTELAPLSGQPFPIMTTIGHFRPMLTVGRSDGLSCSKSLEGSLATFIKRIPRLFEAMKNGQQPEATKLWQKGCEDMVLLLFYRWRHARHLLLVEPYALVPMAPRSYELGTFRGTYVEQGEESDDAYRSSIAERHDAQRVAALRGAELGEFILKMRIAEFPFPPRADVPLHSLVEEACTGGPVFAIHASVVKKALESAGMI